MKKLSIVSAVYGLVFMGAASAANITIYYSPTCPHCHHAREFISGTLIYEYPSLTVSEVNVTVAENVPVVNDMFKKCEYESRGVPVIVVGEKCFQGYADFMQQELRKAVEIDLNEEEKSIADENRKAMKKDVESFKKEHADRENAVSEYKAASGDAEKKNNGSLSGWFYVLLVALVAGLGVVLSKKKDSKK